MLRRVPAWTWWLIVAALSYTTGRTLPEILGLATFIQSNGRPTGWGWLVFLLVATAPLEALIGIIIGLASIDRRKRRRARVDAEARDQILIEHGLAEGTRVFETLISGNTPLPMQIWGVVLRLGEEIHLERWAIYSRFNGQDVTYHTGGRFHLGSPVMVLAGMLAGAIADSAAASRARAQAAPRWREHQNSRVLLTTQRIMCEVNGQWMTFDFACVTSFRIDLTHDRSVLLEFGDSAAPLKLAGYSVPVIGTYLCWALHNRAEGFGAHPALAPLRERLSHPRLRLPPTPQPPT
jgi:hypothetical protein